MTEKKDSYPNEIPAPVPPIATTRHSTSLGRRLGVLLLCGIVGTALIVASFWVSNRIVIPTDSPIKSDEQVIFFPTFGQRTTDGGRWTISIHGCVFEPDTDSRLRKAGLATLREFLDLGTGSEEAEIFQKRAWPFLADNERGKRISVRIGDRCYPVGASEPNGHFQGTIEISADDIQRLDETWRYPADRLRFKCVTAPNDARAFEGRVQLIEPAGLSVISDIDDTVKISDVLNRKELLANTFLREFQPVPGMAEHYRRLTARGACFHYVSASPWQLYEPLENFLNANGFPAGTLNLRHFRLKDSSVVELLASPENYKLETIESLLRAFPERKFILIGDSGERDPEIYCAVARAHPAQIEHILIREVRDPPIDEARYAQAFADVPAERRQVFRESAELQAENP